MSGPAGAGVTPEERDVLRVIGKSWGWVLFFGIVTLILGVLVTLKPATPSTPSPSSSASGCS